MGSYKKDQRRSFSSPEPSNSNKDEMGSYNYKMFNLFNRKFKITEAEPPKDVKQVFSKFSDGGSHMMADQLRRFLVLHQDELHCTLAEAKKIMEEVINRRHHLTRYSRHSLNLDDFFHFLLYDDLNGPITSQVNLPPPPSPSVNTFGAFMNFRVSQLWFILLNYGYFLIVDRVKKAKSCTVDANAFLF